ncbi:KEOPS complex subunit Cgi121 [Halorubellus sp. PRR65]|uniref:KEOPS complex subunit Cgi121 n=1 Tax=Halorubellus sp. PRR65 TaxID=3098148 RepID=UPI002B2585E7|nr:KEOPS complex subunit Cgi121 [Halorubellus sp. PRR65]
MRVLAGTATVDGLDAFVAALGDTGATHDCVVQAFDARYVTGRDHLATALRYAARAHEREDAIARDPAVETLLYAAGRRQIDRALAMGVDEGERPVVVVVASDFPDDALAETDAERECASEIVDLLDAVDAGHPSDGVDSRDAGSDVAADDGFAATDRERVREFFDVTDAELAATDATLADLVRERVVLLSIDH